MKNVAKVMVAKIVMSFGRLPDSKLLMKAMDILESMVGNAYFPTPLPNLENVGDAISNFQTALVGAATRDRTKVVLKNRSRVELIAILTALANYVTFTADGNSAMIASTAFDTRKAPQPIIVTKPSAVINLGPNTGELINKALDASKNRGFVHECTPDPITENSVWESISATSMKYTFSGLIKAKVYWCRVGVVGAKGQLVYSDPVSKVAQ